ncbi:UDP-glycosyltransferase 89B2 [Henckelia pumila]|uniref:UDP-glycosyltransferase 89B2 n=1 Tax=Henckelia pumila TaxID=405737 RepID=UPI003C6E9DBD
MSEDGAHILVFPYPAQGHMIPLLDFTHHLATRGLTITILVTPKNLPQLNQLLSDHPTAVTPLVLPFPPHPLIPPGVENTVDLPAGGFRTMLCAMGRLHDPLLHWFRSHASPPVAIVSDMFLGWTNHLARELNITRYCFYPSGALGMSLVHCLWREMPKRANADDTVEFTKIPNSPVYPWWQLSPVYRSYVEGNPDSEFIKDSFRANLASHGAVFNTFRELESVYLDHLARELGHDRVLSVGPLLPSDEVGPAERGRSITVSATDIDSWLDKCDDHTVVYVCFGSQAVLNNKQMEELALGLEKSGERFILSVKGPTKGHANQEDYGMIPPGFEDRTAGRGLVIQGWAPQVKILKHKAVAAFLTHCGWNSTLEGIVCGVPMLAWPMGADQFANANLLVDELNVAIRVCEGAETVPGSDDLARILALTSSERWIEKRVRAAELSKAATDAIKGGGSSFKNLDDFVAHLSK